MIERMTWATLAALAVFVAPVGAFAQYGTPWDLRQMAPTIEDADPGQEPAPEAKVVPEIYRRHRVLPHRRGARHDHHRYPASFPLSRSTQQHSVALRRRRRTRRLPMERV